eukprot:4189776-Pleurochrysis_carterae.AAC.1
MHRSRCGAYLLTETCCAQLTQTSMSGCCFCLELSAPEAMAASASAAVSADALASDASSTRSADEAADVDAGPTPSSSACSRSSSGCGQTVLQTSSTSSATIASPTRAHANESGMHETTLDVETPRAAPRPACRFS